MRLYCRTHARAQVSLLQKSLARGEAHADGDGAPPECGAEVLTIDKYQGRDKPCIIISTVRSNPEREAGRLLADWQRVNVALTRARSKLVVVGSASTVSAVPLMQQLLALVAQGGGVVSMDLLGFRGEGCM